MFEQDTLYNNNLLTNFFFMKTRSSKLSLVTIMLLISFLSLTAQEYTDVDIPVDPPSGTWKLDVVSDDFNYVSSVGDRPTTFTNRWNDTYIGTWSGPSITDWQSSHIWTNGSYLAVQGHYSDDKESIILGCMSSKKAFVYPLYIEARVKLSTAFLANDIWMLSTDQTQELDVCEAYPTTNPDWIWFDRQIHVAHHIFVREPFQNWAPTDDGCRIFKPVGETWRNEFHTVGMYWESPWLLHYYIDGEHVRTTPQNMIDPNNYSSGTGLNKPEHIIINMEQQDWNSDADRFPTEYDMTDESGNNIMWVDWIRLYTVDESEQFYIVNKATGKKLRSKSYTDGDALEQVSASSSGSWAKWVKVTNGNYFYLRNVESQEYFRPTDITDGSTIIQRPIFNTGDWTQFEQITSTGDYFYLRNKETGMYFRPETDADASKIQQRPTSYGGDWTQWKFVSVSTGQSIKSATALSNKPELNLKAYPNPASSHINISGLDDELYNVSIYNIQGVEYISTTIQGQGFSNINIEHLPVGCYIISIRNDSIKEDIKFNKS